MGMGILRFNPYCSAYFFNTLRPGTKTNLHPSLIQDSRYCDSHGRREEFILRWKWKMETGPLFVPILDYELRLSMLLAESFAAFRSSVLKHTQRVFSVASFFGLFAGITLFSCVQ